MEQYISKAAVVAEIERRINGINLDTIEDWRYRLQWEHDIEVMQNILSFLNTLEVKGVDLEKKKEVIVKGFVAVDNGGDKMTWNPTGRRVAFFPKKPVRDLLTDSHYWAAHISPYDVIHLGYEDFPELKWEDEPIEVELKVKRL